MALLAPSPSVKPWPLAAHVGSAGAVRKKWPLLRGANPQAWGTFQGWDFSCALCLALVCVILSLHASSTCHLCGHNSAYQLTHWKFTKGRFQLVCLCPAMGYSVFGFAFWTLGNFTIAARKRRTISSNLQPSPQMSQALLYSRQQVCKFYFEPVLTHFGASKVPRTLEIGHQD